jgi:protein-disulfide isomerase
MPSGKRARQQRREAAVRTPPPVRSKGGGGARGARQASPRALAIGGGVVLVVVIAIVLAVVLGSGSSKSSTPNGPAVGSCKWAGALDGACDANNLFKGIPQSGLILGRASAPVEMMMFIDVQCPICQRYEVDSLPTIVDKYIKTGKVKLHLQPWAFIGGAGSQSFSGRLGLIAATFQNKGFEYAKVLYDNQGPEDSGWLTRDQENLIAESVNGLNISQWSKDVDSSSAKTIANTVDQLASQKGVSGTPTVLIGPANGQLRDIMPPGYAPTLQITEQALDKALKNA